MVLLFTYILFALRFMREKATSGPVIMFHSVSKTFPTCIPCSEAPGLVRRNVLITLMRGVDGQMDSLVFLPSSE